MNHWLVKQEPTAYAWERFVDDGRTAWTGVRNFQARNNLRAMRKGDAVLYYHSVIGKAIVGTARVEREAYPDPTATSGDWVCVDLIPLKPLPRPVSLEEIKADPTLAGIPLVSNSRLSVQPVASAHNQRILALAATPARDAI